MVPLSSEPGGLWENLIPEALTEVFKRLPFQERLSTVPLVCKTWEAASLDSSCWRTVDIKAWFELKVEEDLWWEFDCDSKLDFLVRKVVDRSCGELRELRATRCSDASIDYVAERCPFLTVLSIPNSPLVTDKVATKLATRCPNLQELDVSDCYNISNHALEAIGRNCTSLVWLGRNMLQTRSPDGTGVPRRPVPGGDEEAIVVSKHMVKLKHLEMKRTSLSDLGLAHLARGCGKLETLNLACCSALSPKALDIVSKRHKNLKEFTKPIIPRLQFNPNRSDFAWMLRNR